MQRFLLAAHRWGRQHKRLMRPSAHAAASATAGSSSDSPATSSPTASGSGVPHGASQLPNAIATLRRSPEYPARRMADPRVYASHSSSLNTHDVDKGWAVSHGNHRLGRPVVFGVGRVAIPLGFPGGTHRSAR